YEFGESSSGVIDSFTLKMSPSAGFAVSADPSAVHLQPGDTGASTVTVLGASADPVSLSVSGCPPGASCAVSPSSGNPPFTSSLSVTTFSSSPAGQDRKSTRLNSSHGSISYAVF